MIQIQPETGRCEKTFYGKEKSQSRNDDAREGIRTPELLQDWTLNPAPLTWLGNPRASGILVLA